MHYVIVTEILEALHTIELFEDTFGLNDGSDLDDPDYGGYNPQLDMFMNEINNTPTQFNPNEPSTAPIQFNFNGVDTGACSATCDGLCNEPSCVKARMLQAKALPKCYYRAPNDAFHDNDPYMYYESREYPTDEDYFGALFTLKSHDELIYNEDIYESLRNDILHYYIQAKEFDIEHRISRRNLKLVRAFYLELQRIFVNVTNEYDRINDLQMFHEGW